MDTSLPKKKSYPLQVNRNYQEYIGLSGQLRWQMPKENSSQREKFGPTGKTRLEKEMQFYLATPVKTAQGVCLTKQSVA